MARGAVVAGMVDDRQRAIGAGIGIGIGLGATWGYLLPTLADGDPVLAMAYGASAGFVIALLAAGAAYRVGVQDGE